MAKRFEYTTLAHRYTARFPLITYIGTQVNFWIAANILLVIILHLYAHIIRQAFMITVTGSLGTMLLIGVVLWFFYGVSLGLTEYQLERNSTFLHL